MSIPLVRSIPARYPYKLKHGMTRRAFPGARLLNRLKPLLDNTSVGEKVAKRVLTFGLLENEEILTQDLCKQGMQHI